MTSTAMHRNSKVSAKKIAQCEARAQQIVERYLDTVENETDFLDQLRWINRDHYQCIVEERAIEKTCGYPLCEEKLGKIPTKRFQICTTKNKVYDLTDRKHFCSNLCYKASCYLKQQLFVSPLWVRECEEEPRFLLLKNPTELKGDEVDFGIERVDISESRKFSDPVEREESRFVKSTTNETSAEKRDEANLVDVDAKSRRCDVRSDVAASDSDGSLSLVDFSPVPKCDGVLCPTLSRESGLNDSREGGNVSGMSVDQDLWAQCSAIRAEHHFAVSDFSENTRTKKQASQSCKNNAAFVKNFESETKAEVARSASRNGFSWVRRVEKSLREWFTLDTLYFIMGAEAVKEIMLEKNVSSETKKLTKCDPRMCERYVALCKKLEILELEEDTHPENANAYAKPTKPVPDFETLKEQTKEMEIKVHAFYRGDKKVSFDENRNENEPEDGTSVVLPPLHQHAKVAIRRIIVLDKLKIYLPDFAKILGVPSVDLMEKIKQLTLTCKFAAHNVTFKPLEWNLICLILIKLLSRQDLALQTRLRMRANYVKTMLMSYQLEINYLDVVCVWLMDLDDILGNEKEIS